MGANILPTLLDISTREKNILKILQTTRSFHMPCLCTSTASVLSSPPTKTASPPFTPYPAGKKCGERAVQSSNPLGNTAWHHTAAGIHSFCWILHFLPNHIQFIQPQSPTEAQPKALSSAFEASDSKPVTFSLITGNLGPSSSPRTSIPTPHIDTSMCAVSSPTCSRATRQGAQNIICNSGRQEELSPQMLCNLHHRWAALAGLSSSFILCWRLS